MIESVCMHFFSNCVFYEYQISKTVKTGNIVKLFEVF